MAVAVLVEAPNFSQSQYDEAIKEVMPGGHMPAGCLSHVAGPMEGGWRVVDMWESQEVFERFAHDLLAGAMAKAGYTQRPDIKIWPVYNTQHTH